MVKPLANGADALKTMGDLAELFPRKVEQLVGIAVARGQRVTKDKRREKMGRDHFIHVQEVFAEAGHHNHRIVAQDVATALQAQAIDDVFVIIFKFARRKKGLEMHTLLTNHLRKILPRFEGNQNGRVNVRFIDQLAADADGKIEWWRFGGRFTAHDETLPRENANANGNGCLFAGAGKKQWLAACQ